VGAARASIHLGRKERMFEQREKRTVSSLNGSKRREGEEEKEGEDKGPRETRRGEERGMYETNGSVGSVGRRL
jgi:hypothetical protein